MEDNFQPQVQAILEGLLQGLQSEVYEGKTYSEQLLTELDIDLPVYNSQLSSVTSENIMPIAVMGSFLMFGWFSAPTILLGYLTIKSREFGLTRYADKTGALDNAIDKIKNVGANGYKYTIKTTVSKAFYDYVNNVSDCFQGTLEKGVEQAIGQINFVEELDKSMQKLNTLEEIAQLEIKLDKAESILGSI